MGGGMQGLQAGSCSKNRSTRRSNEVRLPVTHHSMFCIQQPVHHCHEMLHYQEGGGGGVWRHGPSSFPGSAWSHEAGHQQASALSPAQWPRRTMNVLARAGQQSAAWLLHHCFEGSIVY